MGVSNEDIRKLNEQKPIINENKIIRRTSI